MQGCNSRPDWAKRDFDLMTQRPKSTIFLITLVILLLLNGPAAAISVSIGKPEGFSKLAEKVGPAVVNIFTTKDVRYSPYPFRGVDPFFDQFFQEFFKYRYPQQKPKRQQNSLGSGFIISEDGKILTNYHVIAGADDIFVNLSDGKKSKARVVGIDKKLDLAVLQLRRSGTYPHVTLGDSDKAKIGDWAIAVGNPFGLGQTVTAGIISAKGRVLGTGPYDDFIQTDASINPGNSGGPLFNLDGEVIGINTAIIAGGQGIGFAIPINMVKKVLKQLVSRGRVSRGWLGVAIRDLTEDERRVLPGNQKTGVLVVDVVPRGPAARSGLRAGDIIVGLNGEPVEDKHQLPVKIAEHLPGTKVVISVFRDGHIKEVAVVLGDLDNPDKAFAYPIQTDLPDDDSRDQIGIDVRDLEKGDHPTVSEGVYITHVHPQSMASAVGLMRGDIIIELNESAVRSLKDFKKRLDKIQSGQVIKMEIVRGNERMFFAFKK